MQKFVIAVLAAAAFGSAAGTALAQSSGIGAPTSAAGGVSADPLSPPAISTPDAIGPLRSSRDSGDSDSPRIRDLTPGTGKFEAPNNEPCIGAIGFGSTMSQPGHKC